MYELLCTHFYKDLHRVNGLCPQVVELLGVCMLGACVFNQVAP